MTQFWRIVLSVVGILLILGILLAGTGIITGASLNRIVELLYGGMDGLLGALGGLKTQGLQLLAKIQSLFNGVVASI